MPLVTVALPTRNRASYLAQALAGIVGQTFRDIEILVCDNASTDSTPEIVARTDDPRLVYVRNDVDLGSWDNAWLAISRARGEYVLVTHDDDVLGPTIVEREMAVFHSAPGTALVATNVSHIDTSGTLIQERRIPVVRDLRFARGAYLQRYIRDHLWLPTPTTMTPTVLLRELRPMNRFIGPASDIGLHCLLNTRGSVHLIADPLCAYRQHGIQESRLGDSTDASIALYRYLVGLCESDPELSQAARSARARLISYQAEAAALTLGARTPDGAGLRARVLGLEQDLAGDYPFSEEHPDGLLRFDLLAHYLRSRERPVRRLHRLPGDDGRVRAIHSPRVGAPALYRRWLEAVRGDQPGPCGSLHAASHERVVVLGSNLTAFLLALDARREGVEVVRFVDSSPHRQGQLLAGTCVEAPSWLAGHAEEYDAVVLTSEAPQEEGLTRFLRSVGVPARKPIVSWKALVEALDPPTSSGAPPGPPSPP